MENEGKCFDCDRWLTVNKGNRRKLNIGDSHGVVSVNFGEESGIKE